VAQRLEAAIFGRGAYYVRLASNIPSRLDSSSYCVHYHTNYS
jgi:hypothetical protein